MGFRLAYRSTSAIFSSTFHTLRKYGHHFMLFVVFAEAPFFESGLVHL